jgi:hypothetical protein
MEIFQKNKCTLIDLIKVFYTIETPRSILSLASPAFLRISVKLSLYLKVVSLPTQPPTGLKAAVGVATSFL